MTQYNGPRVTGMMYYDMLANAETVRPLMLGCTSYCYLYSFRGFGEGLFENRCPQPLFLFIFIFERTRTDYKECCFCFVLLIKFRGQIVTITYEMVIL